MRATIGFFIAFVALFLALVLQMQLPVVHSMYDARILIVPTLFCYAALALPVWAALPLAVFTGLILDLAYLSVTGGRVEIALGWSIVYFVLYGVLCQGLQPAFRRGYWGLHTLLAAVGTSLFVFLQYVMISIRREEIIFNQLVLWRILGPGLFAALLSPLLHLIVVWGGRLIPDDSKPYRVR